ncbi:MAG: NTP transferase domain-containing protein [Planctomycetes bacterium]|nr:NTP transferase domain-containing protein [Planctomycetota bacterium]MCB9904238.1 NTP transferase domain-containing protein [Planctomycetota bacterium]
MKPALVILAGGASERLGEPKALVELGGRSVLDRLLDAAANLDRVPLVIGGAHYAAIAKALGGRGECANNVEWTRGRTGSVILAARLREDRDLCLAPVDVPLVPREVFEALAAAWEAAGSPPRGWLAPACDGRFGHPVVVGRELLRQLFGASPDRPLRELRGLADPLWSLETPCAAVLDDLDTPADLAALRARASSP